jgi:FkbM family methyltransferase
LFGAKSTAGKFWGQKMLEEGYLESTIRWHLTRRWRRPPREVRRAERMFHAVMRALPDRNGLFIDLGANVGDVTYGARRYGMNVIAFEPDPDAFSILSRRFEYDPRVILHQNAVGATDRTVTLYRDPHVANDAKASEGSSLIHREKHIGGSSHQVEMVDIVKFIQAVDVPIAVLKMDIEGAEVECLDAIIEAGVHDKIGSMLVETHERFSPELANGIGRIRSRVLSEGINNINLDWL